MIWHGLSSLNYLRSFPIDTLKIDRSFVTDIGSKPGNGLVNAIVAVAQALGLDWWPRVLRHLSKWRICGSAAAIPFRDT